jgi:hypothetical protein
MEIILFIHIIDRQLFWKFLHEKLSGKKSGDICMGVQCTSVEQSCPVQLLE